MDKATCCTVSENYDSTEANRSRNDKACEYCEYCLLYLHEPTQHKVKKEVDYDVSVVDN